MALRNIPKRIVLLGDKFRAVTHVGEADAFLVEIERMASFQKLSQYRGERLLRDGTCIRVEIRFGCPKVTISSPFYGVAPKKRKADASRYGRIIVGSCLVNGMAIAAMWKSWSKRWTLLGTLSGYAQSEARAISENGKVVVGGCASSAGTGQVAYRWTEARGMKVLDLASDISGAGESVCRGVSANGKVIVGAVGLPVTDTITAFIWDHDTGARAFLRDLFPPHVTTHGYGISGDGKVVVGGLGTIDSWYMIEHPAYSLQPYYWADAHGPELFCPGVQGGEATAISSDGNFVVGQVNIYSAFRYDIANQAMTILDTQGYRRIPWATSRNGQVTVGYAQQLTDQSIVRGFVWKKSDPVAQTLPLVIGASFNNALGVSSDGRIVVGQTDVNGKYCGFYQIGDEPAVVLGSVPGGDGSLAYDISGPIPIEEQR
ncbi:MAG: hypothetical protein KKD63_11035 [Proteobacteria bacterium]|nr:hypothetical protein [Desulfobulbaceae bacterium]MBU4153405.1 hypothetical protein [Pseudomonadota bacterium]